MAFDIAGYTNNAHRVRDEDVDYDSFRERPLSSQALRALRYMSDVESHTICYLRDLLVTPSHKDPEITAFLTMWAYEEFWHGEALDKVLRAHEEPATYSHIRTVRLAQGIGDRLAPIHQAIAGNVLGEEFIAVHMSWGAINEWSAHSAYERMMQREDHPELTKLLKRIQLQETRHLAFYNSQARDRLAASARARKITRFALKAFWTPVGSGIQPRAETRFILDYLMGGVEGEKHISRLDKKVDTLPGQEGLYLLARQTGKFGVGPLAATRGRMPKRPSTFRTVASTLAPARRLTRGF
jgi:rubrerythrin